MSLRDVPIHLAIAWVLTRSDEFLLYLERADTADVDQALAQFQSEHHSPRQPIMTGGAEGAWKAALEFLVCQLDGDTDENPSPIWGMPFEKGQHINRVGVPPQPFDTEMDARTVPIPISKDLLRKLVLDVTPTEIRLVPIDWSRQGGWWWKEVEVEMHSFTQFFPTTAVTRVLARRRKNVSPKRLAVESALEALFPRGASQWELLTSNQRDNKIIEWIKANTELRSVDPKTIQRTISEIRTR